MNILITGITGYFGSHLAQEFSSLGRIHGFKRPSSSTDLLKNASFQIEWHEGDISDMDSLLEAMSNIDLVIHAAGLVSFSSRDEERLYQVNRQGTTNVVNAMLSSGVNRLVYISSVAAIGRSPEIDEYDENFKWVDSPINSEYAISKYWAELEVWRAEQEGLEILVVNPAILLGKAAYEKSSAAIYQYVLDGNLFFPKGNLNYIDIRDAAAITRQLVEDDAWGERFILNKESLPYREFFEKVAQVFGVKAPKISISDRLLRFALPILGLLKLIGLSKSPLNRQLAFSAQRKIYYSNSKVQSLLKFNYRGLEETLDWAKQP